ncbi:hypothetical protein I8J38_02400 [Bacillus sp. OA1]|nr:hypothetical protein [Bacillus sp. OA1]
MYLLQIVLGTYYHKPLSEYKYAFAYYTFFLIPLLVMIISTIPFLLLKGNEIIDGIVMFQGWLFIAKLLYLICILMLVAIVTKTVNEKLFVNE